jgi:hypothetical protein
MRIDEFVQPVEQQLAATAALGDERTQQVAASLTSAAGPAVRLAVMSALSAAADEITAALLDAPGAPVVSAQLDGADIRIDVRPTVISEPPPVTDDTDATARISLRLSESLKADVEGAARRDGVSVNTWLVRAATRALTAPGSGGSIHDVVAEAVRRANNAHRITGWING